MVNESEISSVSVMGSLACAASIAGAVGILAFPAGLRIAGTASLRSRAPGSLRVAMGTTWYAVDPSSNTGSVTFGAVGLLVFFLGFEFSIVTSFSIVSEAMPQARGRALAANSALGTAARGIGIVMSGLLYQAYGIKGPVAISVSAAVVALALLTAGIRRS